jgi:hypothetical protein
MDRRTFLFQSAAMTLVAPQWLHVATAWAAERQADVVVIGGGLGGCAAALAAARAGRRVILTEETDWIGGQLTQQAVPPDEHPWIESFGCTRLYRQLREGIRAYYHEHYPLSESALRQPHLNPGNGSVSRLCHEPRVALAVLNEMLASYVSGRRVVILRRHKLASADVEGDRIRAVTVRDLEANRDVTLAAPYFIDATELGDLLPLSKTEFITGAESQDMTGEPHAPTEAQPDNQQAFTCCFAMDYLDGEDHTIERPAEYEFWSKYVPEMKPPWSGPLLAWAMSNPKTLEYRPLSFDPAGPGAGVNLFRYRRIADRSNFATGTYRGDITLVNWPQNDYWLGNLIGVSEGEAARHLARAKQLSLSLLYWMQTEAPRTDGGTGWKGLRLREDLVGTADGLAKYPYIRESRRIKAEFTVTELHVGAEARMHETGKPLTEVTAEAFADSVGVGSYRIDLHPSSGGDNYIDIGSLPFQIPLAALLPQRVENLLPASKNLGVTHITNGCYRLHPVEWNIGEAAGALAAFAIAQREPPRQIRKNARLLEAFQRQLQADGVEIAWPRVTPR